MIIGQMATSPHFIAAKRQLMLAVIQPVEKPLVEKPLVTLAVVESLHFDQFVVLAQLAQQLVLVLMTLLFSIPF